MYYLYSIVVLDATLGPSTASYINTLNYFKCCDQGKFPASFTSIFGYLCLATNIALYVDLVKWAQTFIPLQSNISTTLSKTVSAP